MSLSADDVRWVAHLARLELTAAELATITEQLAAIVNDPATFNTPQVKLETASAAFASFLDPQPVVQRNVGEHLGRAAGPLDREADHPLALAEAEEQLLRVLGEEARAERRWLSDACRAQPGVAPEPRPARACERTYEFRQWRGDAARPEGGEGGPGAYRETVAGGCCLVLSRNRSIAWSSAASRWVMRPVASMTRTPP